MGDVVIYGELSWTTLLFYIFQSSQNDSWTVKGDKSRKEMEGRKRRE